MPTEQKLSPSLSSDKTKSAILHNETMRRFSAFAVAAFLTITHAFSAAADVWLDGPTLEEIRKDNRPFETPKPRNDGQETLIYCMVATAVIETLFFYLCGYRKRKTLTYIFFINLLSNFILNAFLFPTLQDPNMDAYTYAVGVGAFETFVFVFEFLLLGIHTGWKLKIFFLLIASNALSYGIGELFYHFVYG